MTHPNPVTAEQLAASTGKPAATFIDALVVIDQEKLFTTARNTLVASVWDTTSPVNGIDAQQVLDSLKPPAGGAVVMVSAVDGPVRILQPTDPSTGAAIPPDKAQAIADDIADDIAADTARSETMQQLPEDLLIPEPSVDPPVQPILTVEELAATVTAQGAQLADLNDTIDGLVNFIAGEN